MSDLKYFMLKSLGILLIYAVISNTSAHEFSELSQNLPEEIQLELLSILTQVQEQASNNAPADNAKEASFAEQVLLHSGIYEEKGRQYLLDALTESELKDAFEPAPYSAYIEILSSFLHDFESSQAEAHDGEHEYSSEVQKQLTELQQEIKQWLQ